MFSWARGEHIIRDGGRIRFGKGAAHPGHASLFAGTATCCFAVAGERDMLLLQQRLPAGTSLGFYR